MVVGGVVAWKICAYLARWFKTMAKRSSSLRRYFSADAAYARLLPDVLRRGTRSCILGKSLPNVEKIEEKVLLGNEGRLWAKLGHRRMNADPIHGGAGSYLRRYSKPSEKSSVLEAGVRYSVVRVDANGNLQWLELKSSELGLHPRDMDLLSSGSFIPQRATISVRGGKVLVRMENVRALVSNDHVLLFDARQSRSTKETGQGFTFSADVPCRAVVDPHRARDAFAEWLAHQAKQKPSHLLDPMPFHLRILEYLLEETSTYFHQKVDRLKLVVERMLEELTDDVSMGGLQRLLPLKRALTAVEHDVRDAHEAMDQVMGSDDVLQALCLLSNDPVIEGKKLPAGNKFSEKSEHYNRLRQATADMLVTYQREVDDAGSVLEELRKGMDAAQEIWELGLDTTRNRIIRLNLIISISTLSIAVATIPGAFFGMNLPSGYEVHPSLFYLVVGTSSTVSLLTWAGLVVAVRIWPKVVDKRRAQDLAGLRDLLHHLDSIDDIFQAVARKVAGKAVTREEFERILREHPSSQFMRPRELDLIFRMFDTNRTGLLEEEELNATHSEKKCNL